MKRNGQMEVVIHGWWSISIEGGMVIDPVASEGMYCMSDDGGVVMETREATRSNFADIDAKIDWSLQECDGSSLWQAN